MMMMCINPKDFDSTIFLSIQLNEVAKALQKIERLIDTTRNPRLIDANVDHTYDDKFLVAETLTNTSLATIKTCMEHLGFATDHWHQCMEWIQQNKPVTLRFQATESCTFVKETESEVPCSTTITTEKTTDTTTNKKETSNSSTTTTSTRMKRVIKNTHWQVTVSYALYILAGNETDTAVTIGAPKEASEVFIRVGS